MKKAIYLLCFMTTVAFLLPSCECGTKGKKAKYVFYFIGDGMGVNQVNGTEMYLAEKKGRIGIDPLHFTRFPVVNFATTYSRYNSVTCSAAAGTALATGTKTKNGTIGMDSLHQVPLYSVAVKAKEAGKKVGITTSVSIDHATPAAFYAHQPNRSMSYEIGTDLPKTGFDFYAGSGFVKPDNTQDSTAVNLFTLFDQTGYTVLRGPEEYQSKADKASKVIFIQEAGKDKSSLPYAIDRESDDLTLAQITENAIDFLSRDNQDGFFLMVEGGKIDWACHSNDAATVFQEVIDMDKAVQKALDFYNLHPEETLIVITADHETGGIALGTGKYALNLQALQYQKVSKDKLTEKIRQLREEKNNHVSWEEVKNLLTENLGFWKEVELNEEQTDKLQEIFKNTFGTRKVQTEKNLYSENEQLASEAIRILDAIALVGWTSGGHSAGVVPVFAKGAGAQLFTGNLDNTDIPRKIAEAAGY